MIKIKVLGTAAGGGFPQWNCFCDNCKFARDNKLKSRKQCSIAFTLNDELSWNIVNVSPDICEQLNMLNHDKHLDIRQKYVDRIFLTDSQLDHTIGLLCLREQKKLELYCEDIVKTNISNFLDILSNYCNIDIFELETTIDYCKIEKIKVKCKPPVYSNNMKSSSNLESDKVNYSICLKIINTNTNNYLLYCPSILELDHLIINEIKNSYITLIDGTLYSENETYELNGKTSKDMGHITNLEVMSNTGILNKILFIHINNSNPILQFGQLVNNKICNDGDEFIF